MLRFSSIRQRYGAQTVLSLAGFAAATGEHWLVLGASGSGKTTFLNLAAGLLPATEGVVEVGGDDIAKLTHKSVI